MKIVEKQYTETKRDLKHVTHLLISHGDDFSSEAIFVPQQGEKGL